MRLGLGKYGDRTAVHLAITARRISFDRLSALSRQQLACGRPLIWILRIGQNLGAFRPEGPTFNKFCRETIWLRTTIGLRNSGNLRSFKVLQIPGRLVLMLSIPIGRTLLLPQFSFCE
jgi:hypothetical protein